MRSALQRHPPAVPVHDGYVLTLSTTVNGMPVVLAYEYGQWTATVGAHGLVILHGSSARTTLETVVNFLGTQEPRRW